MATYKSWTQNCESRRGVVTVLSKPAHGRLVPSEVTSTITISRVHPERTAHCIGIPTNGFRVDYTSFPNFKGVDNFVLQFSYGDNVDVDHFTVNVR
jgi:hypothetical protein